MNKKYYTAAIVAFLFSCGKPEGGNFTQLPVPTTYTFDNVNYSGQQMRIAMLEEMLDYGVTARTVGTTLDPAILKNMFSNTGSPFADPALNTSGKQLKNKCFLADQSLMEAYMDSLAIAATGAAGGSGIAGIVTSTTNPSKKYVLSANGWDYTEMIEKGMMGGVFYYQAINTYLDNLDGDDNETIVAGEGTAMEHHFDEAFGYFGVPVDFPANTDDVFFWGEYCNDLNGVMHMNLPMMNAFLTARTAISAKKYVVRDARVQYICQNWDKMIAAAAIHEINEAISNFSDDALRNHTLSEFAGFVSSLKYSPHAVITVAEINTILGYIGNNLYTVSSTNMVNAKNMLSTIYGLDDVKDVL